MKIDRFIATLGVLGCALAHAGCDSFEAPLTGDMQADSGHDHRHQHGAGHDHEHEHEDGFSGRHSHSHTHGHRHGKPLYGGRVISIGHSHHRKGETHYHAEVMPVSVGRITFHVLTENNSGESEEFRVEASEIVAYVDRLDKESIGPREVVFSLPDGESGGSTFVATIPQTLLESRELSVVVPKIVLGGQRQTFSFETQAEDNADSSASAAKQEEPST